jgi:two-component system response regulator ResD
MNIQRDREAPFKNTTQLHYQDEHLAIDSAEKFASLDAQRLSLTRKEYELLTVLVENAGRVIPREEMLMRVWGYRSEVRTRTLDVHIRRLRKQLGSYGEQYIETIFAVGYRFQTFHAARRFQPGTPFYEIPLTA